MNPVVTRPAIGKNGLVSEPVIVCGGGIVDEEGRELGAPQQSTDPAGNVLLRGAAEALQRLLVDRIGDSYFSS